MFNKRPVFLNLTQIHFPVTAIVSILHRVAGVIMFFSLPILLWLWQCSLASAQSFDKIQHLIHQPWVAVMIWLIGVAWIYHSLAGLRHLLMDCGFGKQLYQARRSAWFLFILFVVIGLLWGIWIW